jgi:hypothetical protein
MDCGNCVLRSATSATCYGLPQPIATCSFSVQSVVCGDQIGEFSNPVEIMLQGMQYYNTNEAGNYYAMHVGVYNVSVL